MQLDGVLKVTVENHDEVVISLPCKGEYISMLQVGSSARHFRSVKTDMIASLDDEEAIDHDHLEFFISDIS